jgi:hypothetical protein
VSTVILDHSNSEVMTCPYAQATQEAFPEVGVFSEVDASGMHSNFRQKASEPPGAFMVTNFWAKNTYLFL